MYLYVTLSFQEIKLSYAVAHTPTASYIIPPKVRSRWNLTLHFNMSEEGASATEQLIEAGRRNNVELLESLLQNKSADQIASLINESRDPLGNTVLHVAAQNGSCT